MTTRCCLPVTIVSAGLAIVLLGAAPRHALAQGGGQQSSDPHEAQPERPTVATHGYTVAPGYVELEAGVQRISPAPATSQTTTPILFKIGLAPRLQLDIAPSWVRNVAGTQVTAGVGDTTLGIKWQLLQGPPVVGAVAFQPTVTLPTGSAAHGTGNGVTALNLLLISSHDVEGVSIDVNGGYTRRSGDGSQVPRAATLVTVSAGIPLGERFGLTAEIFRQTGNPQGPSSTGPSGDTTGVGLTTGPTYKVTRSVVLDTGVIFDIKGLGGTTAYAGVTWNIGRAWGPRPDHGRLLAEGVVAPHPR